MLEIIGNLINKIKRVTFLYITFFLRLSLVNLFLKGKEWNMYPFFLVYHQCLNLKWSIQIGVIIVVQKLQILHYMIFLNIGWMHTIIYFKDDWRYENETFRPTLALRHKLWDLDKMIFSLWKNCLHPCKSSIIVTFFF